MSQKNHKEQAQSDVKVEQQSAKDANQGPAAAQQVTENTHSEPQLETAEAQADTATSQLDELQKKYDGLHNDYLRLMADFDNYRKRTLKEKSDLLKYGGEDALKKILPVIDDFERAMGALESSDDINAVKEGVELIYNKFKSYLDNNGVKEIPAIGETFDADLHEAITTFPAPTPEQKGKIIDCMTKGYKLNDKVMRYSKVVVGE